MNPTNFKILAIYLKPVISVKKIYSKFSTPVVGAF